MNKHNPIAQFQNWFFEIKNNHTEIEANAMQLHTKGIDGYPETRIVLLKYYDWDGFTFFTNYESNKGKAIYKDPKVQLIFNWKAAMKKVSIEGKAQKVAPSISNNYFNLRPRGSQLSAWASKQSQVVSDRGYLDKQLTLQEKVFEGKEIERPPYWGGYLISPTRIIFEQNTLSNIVTQFSYNLNDIDWVYKEQLIFNN